MKFLPLVWAGLWRKPARTILTVLSIAVAFTLFGLLQGIRVSLNAAAEVAHADRLLAFPRFGAPLPMAFGSQIAGVAGVAGIAPRAGMGVTFRDPKNRFGMSFYDEQIAVLYPDYSFTPEQYARLRRTRNGILVTAGIADKYTWKVEDQVPLEGTVPNADGKIWTFVVVGVAPDFDLAPAGLIVGNLDYFNEARAVRKNTATGFAIKVDNPDRAAEIGQEIEDLFANSGTPVRVIPEMEAVVFQGMFDIALVANGVVVAVFGVLLLLVANTMALSVRERTPEFAVLRSVGFPDASIFAIILLECLSLYAAGAGMGLVSSSVLARNLPAEVPFPTEFIHLPADVIIAAAIAAIVFTAATVVPPGLRLKRMPITEALRAT